MIDYYYQIIEWCTNIDPGMHEEKVLDRLYDGLHASLVEKIYALNPKTRGEFFELAK